ncbi:MAG: amidohydrolase family protein, partial [Phaeodactylibacter sp.]|nr:amidohydrolase family protein [Phaeodactylibacter sp.]
MKLSQQFLTVFLFLFAAHAVFAQLRYLHCGRLIDCAGGQVREEVTVIVDGKTIREVRGGYAEAEEGAA